MLMVGRESILVINCHPEIHSHTHRSLSLSLSLSPSLPPSPFNHLLNFGGWEIILLFRYAVEIVIFNINALANPSLLKAAEVWCDFSQACVRGKKGMSCWPRNQWHIGLRNMTTLEREII